jgi:glutamyl-Q tRNA(Asp) synthetase
MNARNLSTRPYVGRFAPSPTGPLHFGSLVAALASYLDAKSHGGKWLVRIEDVDETRCKPEFAADILRTLERFGLLWDGEIVTQSQRKPAYEQALARLSSMHLTYACACSRKEIADSGLAGIEGPVYPGTCRHMYHGRRALTRNAVRVITNAAPITFTDRVFGTLSQSIETDIGDFVLKRRDGLFAYQLAVVADDIDAGVTDIVRGADLLDSTARQIYLTALLGGTAARYLHIPVATNAEGQKLSKQTLAAGINDADVTATLQHALAFLRQDTPVEIGGSALLQYAIAHWDPARIPAVRSHRAVEGA